MNTDARRRASAAYHARRVAEGAKKVTLWLGPEARAKLDATKDAAGSKDRAAELAILAFEAGAETPPKTSKHEVKHTPKVVSKQPKPAETVKLEKAEAAPKPAFKPRPFVEDAFETEDPAFITHALGVVARAKGMTKLAEETGLTRAALYKALSGDGNPEFATVLKVAHALGFRLTASRALADA